MTDAEKHAQRVLREAVKHVSRQWGGGWSRLSLDQQKAMVRAEILAVIHRIPNNMVDLVTYRENVDAMVMVAMLWEGQS